MVQPTRTTRPRQQRLQYKGKLYSKGVQTDRLLRDIKTVQRELTTLNQDDVDLESLQDVSKQLIQPQLMLHKDKGVKVTVACCLADILRLYAPDPPFMANELRDLFQFFIHLLTQNQKSGVGLACPQGAHFQEYYHLLESLSKVKSILIITELNGAEEMMHDLFKGFLDLIK